jgi:hypothetical protein
LEGSVPRINIRRLAMRVLLSLAPIFGALPIISSDGDVAALFGAAAAAEGSAKIDVLAFNLGAVKLQLRGIAATGAALSDSDFAGLFVFTDAAAFAAQMEKFTAVGLTISEIEMSLRDDPNFAPLVFRDARLANIKAGRIGSLAIAPIKLERDLPGGEHVTVKIGAVAGEALDLGVLARFLSSARQADGEQRSMLVGALNWEGGSFDVDKDKTSFSLGAVSLRDIRQRRTKIALADLVARFTRLGEPGAGLPAAEADLIDGLIDLFECCSLGELGIRDIRFQSGADDKRGVFTLRNFVLAGFGDWKIKQVRLDDLGFSSDEVKFAIGQYAMQGIDETSAIDYLKEHLKEGPKFLADLNPRAFQPDYDKAVLVNVTLDIAMPKGDGNAESGKRARMSLDRGEIRDTGKASPTLMSRSIGLDHLKFVIPANNDPMLQSLLAMGFKDIDGSFAVKIRYDASKNVFSLTDAKVTLAGAAALKADLQLENLLPEVFGGSLSAARKALINATFRSAQLRLDDASLIDKLLAWQAARDHKTREEVKAAWLADASEKLRAFVVHPGTITTIQNALKAFLNNPHSITLSVSAAEPIGVKDYPVLKDPAALFTRLRLDARVNR